ncbi:MAG: hypothetical protein ACM3RP_05335 [Chitinophagales bacterium]
MTLPDLERLRAEVEAYQSELNQEYYRNYAGHQAEFDLAGIYRRHGAIFARPQLEAVRAELERVEEQLYTWDGEVTGPAGDDAKRLRFLYEFLLQGHLGERVKEADEALTIEEAKAVVKVDGEEIPYRQLSARVANTADRRARARLHAAGVAEQERRNPDRLARWRSLHAAARELGYRDYAHLCAESRQLDLEQLVSQLSGLLRETDDLYEAALAPAWQAAVGRSLAGAQQHDLARLWRAPQFDRYFPAGRVVDALQSSLAGLGIELAAQHNIVLDTEARPGKAPRAFCAPVRVPDEIYLVILPKGGPDDYEAILHEAGHAEHFGHTGAHRPMEYRWLGDYAVTEAHAFTLEHLVTEPGWLAELGLPDDEALAFRRFAYLKRLFFVRRYAGKLAYEWDLHRADDPALLRESYVNHLLEATLVHYPGANFLTDLDDAFYAANYLRAWLLEAQVKETLRQRFGPQWFKSVRAGQFLRGLWEHGEQLTAEELSAELGWPALDPAALLAELKAALG